MPRSVCLCHFIADIELVDPVADTTTLPHIALSPYKLVVGLD